MPLLYRKKQSNGKIKCIEVPESDVDSYLNAKVNVDGKQVSYPWSKDCPELKKGENIEYSQNVSTIPPVSKKKLINN